MPGDYKKTHAKILKSAEIQFLKKGYERTNLREICREAGVTIGAFYNHFQDKHSLFGELVQPCIDGIHQRYEASEKECLVSLSSEDFLKAWEVSNSAIRGFLDFIYDNLTGFRLLLLCSDGTRFSNFVEDLVTIEVEGTYAFFKEMDKRNIRVNRPPPTAIHMLTHTYFSAIFECVVHAYPKEDARESIDTFIQFFKAGWQTILGLNG